MPWDPLEVPCRELAMHSQDQSAHLLQHLTCLLLLCQLHQLLRLHAAGSCRFAARRSCRNGKLSECVHLKMQRVNQRHAKK